MLALSPGKCLRILVVSFLLAGCGTLGLSGSKPMTDVQKLVKARIAVKLNLKLIRDYIFDETGRQRPFCARPAIVIACVDGDALPVLQRVANEMVRAMDAAEANVARGMSLELSAVNAALARAEAYLIEHQIKKIGET